MNNPKYFRQFDILQTVYKSELLKATTYAYVCQTKIALDLKSIQTMSNTKRRIMRTLSLKVCQYNSMRYLHLNSTEHDDSDWLIIPLNFNFLMLS